MLVERFVKAVCERGLDVDSLLVITYTERAAGNSVTASAPGSSRPGASSSHELDAAWISTIHGFCHRLLGASVCRGHRPALPGPRRRAGARPPARGVRAGLTDFCAGGDEERLGLLSTYGVSGPAPDAHRRPRDAACCRASSRASSWASVLALRRGARSWRKQRVPRRTRRRGRGPCHGSSRSRCSRRTLPERARPRRAQGKGRAGGKLRGSSAERRAGGARRAGGSGTGTCCRSSSSGSVSPTAREGTRVGARLRGPPALRARPAPGRASGAGARELAVPLDHGRRVPGHEQAAVRDRRPARRGPDGRSSSSSGTSSSPSTAFATPTSRSSASGAKSRAACSRSPRTTALGPRCSPPSTTSSRASSVPSSSRSRPPGAFPTRSSGPRSSCSSRTSRATPAPDALAPRRGPHIASA